MASRGRSAGDSRGAQARARTPARDRQDGAARAPPPDVGEPPVKRARERPDLSTTWLRPLAERPTLAAALLLALPVLVYLWPVLVGGKILSPISVLYLFTPWAGSTPPDVASYTNILLSDIPMAVYPWREFAREAIRSGTLPIWNPHVFTGVPFFSNPHNGLFSPFNVPLWVLPLNYALGLSAALKLWAGAFGTYLLARQLRLAFLPGLLGGVAFAFSSLNIVWLTHETLPAVAVMLPWMVWLVERIFERGRLGSVLGLAVVTAAGLGGGHPGTQIHLLGAVALYVVLRAAFTREGTLAERLRPVGLAAGGMVVGVLLMSIMLLPELLSSRGTIGISARQGARGTLPGTQMPFTAIRTVLFPDWWGRTSAFEIEERTQLGLSNFNERTFYPGVVAFLLACVGLLARGDWRRKGPFAILGALGLAITLHAPVLWWLVTHVPPFDLVQNQRLHFLFEFGVAVLAAFGLQALLERPMEERRRLFVPLVALLVGLIAFAGAGAKAGEIGHVVTHFLTGKDFHTPGVLALTAVAWFVLFTVGVGIVLFATDRWPQWATALAVLVILLAAFDGLHFAHGYQPMGAASKVIPPRTPAIAYLEKHAADGRIVGLNYAVTNDWSLIYGLNDIRGYDPPYPTARFFRLWLVANAEQTDWQPFSLTDLGGATVKVSSVLGARYIVTDPGVGEPPREDPALLPLTRVYAGDDATIFRNADAAPRAMVAPAVDVASDEDGARAELVEEDFDPHESTVVERDDSSGTDVASLAGGARVHGRVSVTDEQNTRVTLRATLDQRGLVVLNDQLTPGWSVRVDGHDADVVRVNDVMRGVVVPAGSHQVEWRYALPGLRAGFLLSLLGFVGLLGAGIALVVRARR